MKNILIKEIFSGLEEIFSKDNISFYTSYRKKSILKKVFVNFLGFESDNQSDKRYHGGVDQAICVFCEDEYEFLKIKYGFDLPKCSFGENITLLNISDKDICIGDIFKCGEVIFEVSHPRVPCHKISDVTGIKDLTSIVKKECKTGFYLRVIKEGNIEKSSSFKLEERKYPKYSIEFVNKCLIYPEQNKDNIKKLLICKELSETFKKMIEKNSS